MLERFQQWLKVKVNSLPDYHIRRWLSFFVTMCVLGTFSTFGLIRMMFVIFDKWSSYHYVLVIVLIVCPIVLWCFIFIYVKKINRMLSD